MKGNSASSVNDSVNTIKSTVKPSSIAGLYHLKNVKTHNPHGVKNRQKQFRIFPFACIVRSIQGGRHYRGIKIWSMAKLAMRLGYHSPSGEHSMWLGYHSPSGEHSMLAFSKLAFLPLAREHLPYVAKHSPSNERADSITIIRHLLSNSGFHDNVSWDLTMNIRWHHFLRKSLMVRCCDEDSGLTWHGLEDTIRPLL